MAFNACDCAVLIASTKTIRKIIVCVPTRIVGTRNKSNLRVVTCITQKLDYLCGGENTDPKKVEKAEEKGVRYLTEAQFICLIETGEV